MRDRGRSMKYRSRHDDTSLRDGNERGHVAQVAARLILDHGLSDWGVAKRKAARQLMLPDRITLPGDDEVEAALIEHQSLFGGPAHAEMLRDKRELALTWMRRLDRFAPVLVGGVAAGWAGEHNDVRIELTADESKAVEILLVDNGVHYRVVSDNGADGRAELAIETPRGNVRLILRTPNDVRQRPRRDRHGREPARLGIDALNALLNAAE